MNNVTKRPINNIVSIKVLRLIKNIIWYSHYLFWLLIDPTKFKRIKIKKIKKLLIIYAGAIGDAYNVIGIMNGLNKKYPNVEVYYLTPKKNRKYVKSPNIKIVDLKEAKNLIDKREFNALVLLQGATLNKEIFDKKMYIKILKIPYRVACDEAQIRPDLFLRQLLRPLLTRMVYSINRNSYLTQLNTFKMLGFDINKPLFYYTKSGEKYADNFMKQYKILKKEKLIFLHPGSGKTLKAIRENKLPGIGWRPERWARVSDKLISKYKSRIVLDGTLAEKSLIDEIVSKMKIKKKVINLTGKSSIEGLASVFKRSDLLISVDTATVHFGGQTGIPEIILYSTNHPKRVSPLTSNRIDIFHPESCHCCGKYACSECYNKCMGSITVKEVMDAANSLLNKNPKIQNGHIN